jgi:gas vesicle protein
VKRVFSLLLVLALTFLCAAPASAASIPGQYDVVDLLATGVFPEGDLAITKSASTYSFTWDVTASSSMAFVYLNIYAPSVPSSVTLNGITGTRVYSGTFYQYKFSVSKVLSTVTVNVNFNSSVSRTVSIGWAVGAVSGQSVFTSFTRRSRGFSASTWSVTTGVQIPGGGAFASTISSDVGANQRVNDFELVFDLDMATADYATVHLLVPAGAGSMEGGWRYAYATEPSFFLGSSYTHTFPLDIINFNSYYDSATSIGYGRGSWHLVYTVDVSGYKLDTYDLICCFSLLGVLKSGTTNTYGFHFNCLSACLGINVDGGDSSRGLLPWLNTQFSNIKSAITSLGTTISSQFSSLKSSLGSWFSSLENKIQAAVNPPKTDAEKEAQSNVESQIGMMDEFEEQQFSEIQNGTSQLQTDIADGVNSFVPALAFIGKYTTAIGNGIKDYIIVFMLPIYLGIFFFVCNRVSGVTHVSLWKRKGD